MPIGRMFPVAVLVVAIVASAATAANSTSGWRMQANFGNDRLSSIACASATRCWAIGEGGIYATSDAGQHWHLQPVPAPGLLEGVACASLVRCWAVGTTETISTSNGGRLWRRQRIPSAVADLYGVACVSTSTCWAVGDAKRPIESGLVMVTHDGGAQWRTQNVPRGTTALVKITCTSPSRCWALDLVRQAVVFTRDGGRHWLKHALPPRAGVSDIACSRPVRCVAVGDHVFSTTNGAVWTRGTIPRGIPSLGAVACVGSHCRAAASIGLHYAATGEIIATTNMGRTWTRDRAPSGTQGVVGPSTLACLSADRCWAAEFPSIILVRDRG
jgi:photosystem II stability/assembly factor-like uncharacterized protein